MSTGLTPVVCIGETQGERDKGQTEEVILRQLNGAFEGLTELRDLVLAYEPVWAIGTGLTATDEQAQEVHSFIRNQVVKRFGEDKGNELRLLYGGSAKPSNIRGLIDQSDIDGGLVGGASLKPIDFAEMLAVCQS